MWQVFLCSSVLWSQQKPENRLWRTPVFFPTSSRDEHNHLVFEKLEVMNFSPRPSSAFDQRIYICVYIYMHICISLVLVSRGELLQYSDAMAVNCSGGLWGFQQKRDGCHPCVGFSFVWTLSKASIFKQFEELQIKTLTRTCFFVTSVTTDVLVKLSCALDLID